MGAKITLKNYKEVQSLYLKKDQIIYLQLIYLNDIDGKVPLLEIDAN